MAGAVIAGVCAVALAAAVSACAATGASTASVRTLSGPRVSSGHLDAPALEFDSPDAVAVQGATVWVANGGGNSVTEINAATGALIRVITASRYRLNEPMGITTSGNTVWVADKDSVTEINAATGALIRVLGGSRYPFSGLREIAASGDTVWTAASPSASGPVTSTTTATFTIAEINAATGALIREITAHG
jgi:DNA-binding beta-propeller fold protein YncE